MKASRCCKLSAAPFLRRRASLVFTSSEKHSWRVLTAWFREAALGGKWRLLGLPVWHAR